MQQVCFVGFLLNFRRGHLSAMGCRVRFQQAVFVLLRQTFLLRGTQQPYEPLFMCFFPGISPSSQSSSRGQLVGLESFSAVSVCAQGCVYICVDFVLTTATREGNQSPGADAVSRDFRVRTKRFEGRARGEMPVPGPKGWFRRLWFND